MATEPERHDLQVLGQAPRERADAVRNRERILSVAAAMLAERGAGNVTMDDIASAAGVGKGTLYRRFGDQAGLALALLEEHEIRLQAAVLHGPPPLGPGATPGERLVGFLGALADLLEAHLDLYLRSEAGAARYRSGTYAFWRLHIRVLVEAATPS